MTDRHPDDLTERILQFFANHPREHFTVEELARRLSVKHKDEARALGGLLNELSQSRLIDRLHRKRFGHLTPPRSHTATGIVKLAKQGHGTVDLLPPHQGRVFIQNPNLGTALDGDTVRVTLYATPTPVMAKGQSNMARGRNCRYRRAEQAACRRRHRKGPRFLLRRA